MGKEKIIDRIKKLLTLGDRNRNAHENEAMAAFAKAKKLMEEHNIEIAEVALKKGKKEIEFDLGETEAYRKKGRTYFLKWEMTLGYAAALLTETKLMVSSNGWNPGLLFFGDKADTEVAAMIYKILKKTALRLSRNVPETRKKSIWTRSGRYMTESMKKSSFLFGFADSLLSRAYKKMTPEPSETALVLNKKRDKINATISKNKRHKSKWKNSADPLSQIRGMLEAKKINLNFREGIEGK